MFVPLLVIAAAALQQQDVSTTLLPVPFPDPGDLQLRARMVRVEKMLAKEDFKTAKEAVDRLSLDRIRWSLDLSQVPADSRGMVLAAMDNGVNAWVKPLRDVVAIEKTEGDGNLKISVVPGYSLGEPRPSDLVQSTEPGCQSFVIEPGVEKNRHLTARIYLDQGPEGTPHNERELTHLAARAMGYYFGLKAHVTPVGVMGTDLHGGLPTIEPSGSEVAAVEGLVKAAKELRRRAEAGEKLDLALPEIAFETTNVEIGVASADEPIKAEIRFKNSGQAPLYIPSIGADCKCVAQEWDHEVMPGESGSIRVTIEGATLRGSVTRHIAVYSNDMENPKQLILLNLVVMRDLASYPPNMSTVDLPIDEDHEETFFVYSPTGKSFHVTSVACVPDRYTATFIPGKKTFDTTEYPNLGKAEHDGYLVTVKVPKTEGHGGPFYARVMVETDLESSTPSVAFRLQLTKGIRVQPGVLHITVQGERFDKRVVQLDQDSDSFKILKVEMNSEDLEARVETLKENHSYRVWFTPKLPIEPNPSPRSVRAIIHTDSPRQPKIPITIWVNILPAGAPANAPGGLGD